MHLLRDDSRDRTFDVSGWHHVPAAKTQTAVPRIHVRSDVALDGHFTPHGTHGVSPVADLGMAFGIMGAARL